jgi:uncharacterized protein with HEPN domain
MLDAAQEARAFAHNRRRDELAQDRQLTLALVKTIEIIGEAASQITFEVRQQHPEIPWPSIIAMRNRLVHAYFDIDLDRVWDTLTDDLPPLTALVEKILEEDPN